MSASPFTDIASRDARLKRLFAAVRLNQRATAVMQGALPPGMVPPGGPASPGHGTGQYL